MSSIPSLFALALSVITAAATLAPKASEAANSRTGMPVATQSAKLSGNDGGVMEVARSADGFFYIPARIGKVSVTFLIDTGTNMVILPRPAAARIGLAAKGKSQVETVGGMLTVTLAKISKLETAGQTLNDVPVAIQENDQAIALMGVNTLSQLGRIEIDGDRLTIHRRSF